MKTLLLTLALLTSLFSQSQIGVLTLKKNDRVKTNMWYTVDQKGRENNLYITYRTDDEAVWKLEEILSEYDIDIDEPSGKDEFESPYWNIEQQNGYFSTVYYIKEKNYELYTITIVTTEAE